MQRLTRVIVFLVLILGSCGERKVNHSGKTVFRYNESKGIRTLDPAYARNQTIIWPVNQLFNGLVQLDNALKVQPAIAKSWEVSKDGLTYTFHLRDDVCFHDSKVFGKDSTRKVVASDFVYSFERLLDPGVASPGIWIFDVVNKQNGFTAINDSTFQVKLNRVFPAFLGLLTMQYCSVVPKEAIAYHGENFRRNPIGTGPFIFKYWKEGEKLILLKNPNYFEKNKAGEQLPHLDGVSISFISDKQSEFMEFMKGEIDFLSGVHAAYKDELLTRDGKLNPKYEGILKMQTSPYLNTEYLGILMDSARLENNRINPLNIKEVRQAINHGFNRKKMMTYLRNNLGYPATEGFIPRGMPSYDESIIEGYTHDPDKARLLLEEAGFPKGNGMAEITLSTTSDYLDIVEYLQHELFNIGIKINIELSPGGTYRDLMENGKLVFFRGSWIADYPDGENYLALFYSKNFSPAGPNYTHFSNRVYDKLYEKSLSITNDSIRYKLYREMDQIIIDEAPIVPLYYDKVVRFSRVNLEGLEPNPLNLLKLKTVKKQVLK
jgi:peptide/nickel transport system substrate-binding protein